MPEKEEEVKKAGQKEATKQWKTEAAAASRRDTELKSKVGKERQQRW